MNAISFINDCLMVAALAAVMVLAARLDGPSDIEAAQDVADEVAMQEVCGENSGHYRIEDGRIQCLTKHAKKASIK